MTDGEYSGAPEPAALGLDLLGNPLPVYERAVRAPMGHSPLRRPGSIRRTMSIDVNWPDDASHQSADEAIVASRFDGRARDIFTPPNGDAPMTLSEDRIVGHLDARTIADVESVPPRADVAALAGERAGSNLRAALDRALHVEKLSGAPLYLLLDDLAGASLVCMWGWARWHPDKMVSRLRDADGKVSMASMAGVCIGFRPGSSALVTDETRPAGHAPNSSEVLPLPNPADPEGWHALPEVADVPNFRRARLIDIWREGDILHAESIFQDSASLPGSTLREAIHEYRLRASADVATGTLLTLEATPGTLPHPECPAAMANIGTLAGLPMDGLREAVLERLKRTSGCTHLNDMIRALAEVPVLAGKLPG